MPLITPTPLRLEFVRGPGDYFTSGRLRLDADGPTYRSTVQWYPQAETWVFSLATTAGVPIINGGWLRDRTDVLLRISSPGRPRGAIISYDPRGRGDPVADSYLLGDVGLWYLPGGFDPMLFTLYETAVT